MQRRQFVQAMGVGSALGALVVASNSAAATGAGAPEVLVVGCGFGVGNSRQVRAYVVGPRYRCHADGTQCLAVFLSPFQCGVGRQQNADRYYVAQTHRTLCCMPGRRAPKRWCEVDFLTFESKFARNIHVLADAIQTAAFMPKSGHMANQRGKTCAAAVVALLTGRAPNDMPIYNNTCYSFVSDEDAVHVASVHRYDPEKKNMVTVAGSGGVSSAANALEGRYALAWAHNIWADTLA